MIYFRNFLFIALLTGQKVMATPNIELKCVVDEHYLIAHTLHKNSNSPPQFIVDFKNQIWMSSREEYEFLLNQKSVAPYFLEKMSNILKPLFESARDSIPYQRLLKETRLFSDRVCSEWQDSYSRSIDYISKTTRLILDKSFKVFITHPALGNGQYLGQVEIAYGAEAAWQNHPGGEYYHTVYLWHEILHSYMERDPISHAVNQLVTDNGLRTHLGNGKLMPFEGHKHLLPLAEEIHSNFWNNYLDNSTMDILEFVEFLKKQPKLVRFSEEIAMEFGY